MTDDANLVDVIRGHITTREEMCDEADERVKLRRTHTLDLMLVKYRGAREQHLLDHPEEDVSTDEDADYRQEEGGEG